MADDRQNERTHRPPCGARSAAGGTGAVSGVAAPAPTRSPRQSTAPVPVPPTTDQGVGMAPQWPLQDFLELGALLGAAPSARLHVRHILWEWGLTRLADPVEHVITELVANAVAAVEDMPKVQPIRI